MDAIEFIKSTQFIPCVMMTLCFLCACRYGLAREWSQVVYWFGAFLLNFAVTFLMKK
jgi:hypothetical protein